MHDTIFYVSIMKNLCNLRVTVTKYIKYVLFFVQVRKLAIPVTIVITFKTIVNVTLSILQRLYQNTVDQPTIKPSLRKVISVITLLTNWSFELYIVSSLLFNYGHA